MSDEQEIHSKIVRFLAEEFARTDGRQCIGLELIAIEQAGRDTTIMSKDRRDEPKWFDASAHANLEELATLIVNIATDHVDSYSRGEREYMLRTHQHLGKRMFHRFAMMPARGMAAMVVAGGPGGASAGGPAGDQFHYGGREPLAPVIRDLLHTNTEMHRSSFGTLARMHEDTRDRVARLEAENAVLRHDLLIARSDKDERELAGVIAVQADERKGAMFGKVMQLASIAATKFLGAGGSGPPSAILALVADFAKSLSKPQQAQLFQILNSNQQMMLMTIVNEAQAAVAAADAAGQTAAGAQGPAGNHGQSNGAAAGAAAAAQVTIATSP